MNLISHYPNCITTIPEKNISLRLFLQHIKDGTYQEEILNYRQLIKTLGKDSPRTKEFKRSHIPAVTYAGTFKKRQTDYLITASNLIIIDIDNWTEVKELKAKLSQDEHLQAAFISPGEAGLKLIFKISHASSPEHYKEQYLAITHYLHSHYNIPLTTKENPTGLDTSCCDITRLCLYSHDPDIYINPKAKTFLIPGKEAPTSPNQSFPNETYSDISQQIETITRQIESRCLDITSGYHNWLSIGFALESELAEAGREYFHRISQFHPNYNEAQCNKQYYYIQKSKGTGITIKTFFHKAKEHGIDLNNYANENKQEVTPSNIAESQETEELEEDDTPDQRWINPKETPPFPLHIFPEKLKEFIQAAAASINCPPDFIAVPMLTALGVAIGTSRTVEIKKGWTESARIYSAIVAEPGSRKTPALNLATSPVLQLQKEYAKNYYQKKRNFEEALKKYEHKQDKSETRESKTTQRPTPPQMKQLTTNDATMEALSGLLRINPRGVLFEQDELAGWVKGMNQYRGGKGSDQEKWLSFWSGKQTIINRKGDDEPLLLNDPFISVTGCIQPDILNDLSDGRNNGFLDRILFTYPASMPLKYSETEIAQHLLNSYHQCFNQLIALKHQNTENTNQQAISLPFSLQAKKEWLHWIHQHYAERNHPDFPWYLNGIWAKLEAYTARFALILELATNPNTKNIDASSIKAATELSTYFKAHACKVYQELNSSPADKRITKAIQWIKRKGGTVTLRQCYTYKIASCKTREQAEALFKQIQQRGLAKIEQHSPKTGGHLVKKLVLL